MGCRVRMMGLSQVQKRLAVEVPVWTCRSEQLWKENVNILQRGCGFQGRLSESSVAVDLVAGHHASRPVHWAMDPILIMPGVSLRWKNAQQRRAWQDEAHLSLGVLIPECSSCPIPLHASQGRASPRERAGAWLFLWLPHTCEDVGSPPQGRAPDSGSPGCLTGPEAAGCGEGCSGLFSGCHSPPPNSPTPSLFFALPV